MARLTLALDMLAFWPRRSMACALRNPPSHRRYMAMERRLSAPRAMAQKGERHFKHSSAERRGCPRYRVELSVTDPIDDTTVFVAFDMEMTFRQLKLRSFWLSPLFNHLVLAKAPLTCSYLTNTEVKFILVTTDLYVKDTKLINKPRFLRLYLRTCTVLKHRVWLLRLTARPSRIKQEAA
ncbi:hypothetical protein Bca4012_005958 [Brassica carinata]|uniref:Uncharacterized protein n=1 Tax=Brassica carinata TaxID=52824 RepID=A0A8X7RRT0_BRACI|nr:hypothetical protein Bca52824_039774 [Brassica carinata]